MRRLRENKSAFQKSKIGVPCSILFFVNSPIDLKYVPQSQGMAMPESPQGKNFRGRTPINKKRKMTAPQKHRRGQANEKRRGDKVMM